MQALSVRAPWWWAILHGKPVENRAWPTHVRGRIALHASKFWNLDEIVADLQDIDSMFFRDGLPVSSSVVELPWMRSLGGCVVGTVEITACVTAHRSAFFVGRYGFVLANPSGLARPFPLRGSLGFFYVPDAVMEDAK